MKGIILILSLCFVFTIKETINFMTALEQLKILENYMKEYIKQTNSTKTLDHLILAYIREGKYNTNEWTIAGGTLPDGLKEYIIKRDEESGTTVQNLRTYGDIELPTKEITDFVHTFAVMNGLEYGKSFVKNFAGLVGWAGDTAQLFLDISKKNGTFEDLLAEAKKLLGSNTGGFGQGDLISDLDSPNIYNIRLENQEIPFNEILFKYYNETYYKDKNYINRIYNFVKITFPEITTISRNNFRDILFSRYNNDVLIKALECSYGLRNEGFSCIAPGDLKPEFTKHQKAAIYAFSDYIFENYITP